ncbi:helix-turn-helix transcriptional regulator [Candidatus Peribacteria bacterium]|nr:helix-turn-helix transcriptional regulator [Candidatus Peribacteria bacterium]
MLPETDPIAARIRTLMDSQKVTMGQLGAVIDPTGSQQYITQYQRARRFLDGELMTLLKLKRVAEYFNVPLSSLTGESPDPALRASYVSVPHLYSLQHLHPKSPDTAHIRGWVNVPLPSNMGFIQAVTMQGHWLHPRVREGDLMLLQSVATLTQGQVQVLRLHTGVIHMGVTEESTLPKHYRLLRPRQGTTVADIPVKDVAERYQLIGLLQVLL